MNDRFRFRVWDGVMYRYDCQVGVGNRVYEEDGDLIYTADGKCVIEQCTGLKDKNGKLIYEGDKVEISVYGDVINEGFVETDTQYQGIVVWAKQGFYVEVADEFFYIPEEPEDVEIIGNIHEQAKQKDVK